MASTTWALDPLLLLLLRAMRDHAVSASIERGVTSLNQDTGASAPTFGYALPTPPVAQGSEDSRLRTVIDDSFLYLKASQRDAVYEGMRKIINDPQNAAIKGQIIAEFSLKAKSARESYRALDRLSSTEKLRLAQQAGAEFKSLAPAEQRDMLNALEAGVLPVPRDLAAAMLAQIKPAAGETPHTVPN